VTYLVASTVADHDEEGAVVGADTICDEGLDAWVELFPHGECSVGVGNNNSVLVARPSSSSNTNPHEMEILRSTSTSTLG
jgi:hypothetical protein